MTEFGMGLTNPYSGPRIPGLFFIFWKFTFWLVFRHNHKLFFSLIIWLRPYENLIVHI